MGHHGGMTSDARPLYAVLADDLRKRISTGEYGPGSKLPSERHLCEEHDASRNTVRSALQRLVAEGLIVASHGRGYTVRRQDVLVYNSSRSEDHARRISAGVDAWVQDIREQGRTPSQEISVGIEHALPNIAKILEVDPDALVLARRRARFVDGKPWSTEDSFYPYDLVKDTQIAEPADIAEGVIALMASLGYVQIRYIDDVTARMPNPAESKILNIDPGLPVLVRTRTGHAEDRPVRVTVTVMPTDRNVLRYELSGVRNNG